jgi:hypothetical protein
MIYEIFSPEKIGDLDKKILLFTYKKPKIDHKNDFQGKLPICSKKSVKIVIITLNPNFAHRF